LNPVDPGVKRRQPAAGIHAMRHTPTPDRLSPADTALLVIDVQEKLIPKIAGAETVVRNIAFLIDACKILDVPVFATEQYPKGLGRTVPELATRLPTPLPEKLAFSSCAIQSVVDELRAGRPRVLLAGIETHVCVMQTALDLLALGFRVFLAVDALGSRFRIDHDTALLRMRDAGATVVTCEMAAFELTGVAGTPRFKEISRLVQERMKTITGPS
jgi:nicotinamidase-related amidase